MENIIKVESFVVIKEEPLDDYETLASTAPIISATEDTIFPDNGFPLSIGTHEISNAVKLEKESPAENSTAMKNSEITYSTFKTYGSTPGRRDYSRKPRATPIIKTETPDIVNMDGAYTISHSEMDEREGKPRFYRVVNAVSHFNESNEHSLADEIVHTFSTYRNDNATNDFQALASASHSCTYRFKPFMTMEKKVVHEREHTMEKPPYKCAHCARTFTQTNERVLHEQTHTVEKLHTCARPYKCDYCGKTFKYENIKKFHEHSMHMGERPHKCNRCEKTFTKKSDLKVHELVHTGEKPFRCGYCSMAFARKNKQVQHERLHTGEKPYKCDYCEKTFTQIGNKNVHMRTHTGEKPYSCSYCERTFPQKGGKIAHERTHADGMPFQCVTCSKRFERRSDVLYHHKVNHKGKANLERTYPTFQNAHR